MTSVSSTPTTINAIGGSGSERMPSSLYEVLNVPIDANQTAIRRAYRRRALLCHPDKAKAATTTAGTASGGNSSSGGNTTSCSSDSTRQAQPSAVPALVVLPPFTVLQAAAEVLLDPIQRADYDTRRDFQALRGKGRISNTDEVPFMFNMVDELAEEDAGEQGEGPATNSTETNLKLSQESHPPTDELFGIVLEDEDDEDHNDESSKNCERAHDINNNNNNNTKLIWVGLECRCGGLYRLEVPLVALLSSSTSSVYSAATRTAHVECDSCSLVIAVSGVPCAGQQQDKHHRFKSKEDRDETAKFNYLFV